MSVYVDDFYVTGMTYKGMKMCHMTADTREELLDMVEKIGVKAKWIQDKDTVYEHFDICLSKRKIALSKGAIAIGMREGVTKIKAKDLKTYLGK